MLEFFKRLFNSSDFMPHGHCYMWHTDVLWTNIVGDAFIALAYYSIPIFLIAFVRRRPDFKFHWVFVMFGVFIFACGTTHVLDIYSIWTPVYRLQGLVKILTALASVGTAFQLSYLLPIALRLPSGKQLEDTNARLLKEIEDRKQIEEDLRDREQKLRFFYQLVNNASDAVIGTDLNYNVTTWNKGAERMYGYTETEALGKPAGQLLHTEFVNANRSDVMQDVFAKGNWRGEVRQRTKSGALVSVLASSSCVYDHRHQPIGFIAVNHDISDRKADEEKLNELNRALQRSNEQLQSFAFVASHDLKEPLRKIQVFADRVTEKESERLSDTGKDYFARMKNAASRMDTLIEDLLTYSRMNTDGQPFVPTDLNALVNAVVGDVSVQIAAASATVRYKNLPTVNGIPSQLRQLFQNLISNAVKFCKPDVNPVVTITSDDVVGSFTGVPELDKTRTYVRIVISDNGIGFDPENAERIFELFQRLHTRQQYSGTGIGLAVCRRVAENHGGTVKANSIPGEGSEFTVYLAK